MIGKNQAKFICLIFITLVFFCGNLFGSDFINYFKCPGEREALSCLDKCEKIGVFKFTIISEAIAERKIVITREFEDKTLETVLDNCQFVDQNNWLCQEVLESINQYSFRGYRLFQMIDGRLSQQNNLFSEISVDKWTETFFCTKG